jgi:hypothetical protein
LQPPGDVVVVVEGAVLVDDGTDVVVTGRLEVVVPDGSDVVVTGRLEVVVPDGSDVVVTGRLEVVVPNGSDVVVATTWPPNADGRGLVDCGLRRPTQPGTFARCSNTAPTGRREDNRASAADVGDAVVPAAGVHVRVPEAITQSGNPTIFSRAAKDPPKRPTAEE